MAFGPLIVFGLFLLVGGADPVQTYVAMFQNTLVDPRGAAELTVRWAPLVLAALATALPARARLINVGGEGQILVGALTTAALGVVLPDWLPIPIILLALTTAGGVGGAVWAGIPAVLRVRLRLNEAISTLLLNYVAFFVVGYFVHGPLKDPASFNWPFSPPLSERARFPTVLGSRAHVGLVIAPVAALVLWYLAAKTYWGFRMRVVGGNPDAARRAGIDVNRVHLTAMFVGGLLAGVAGALEVAGVEGRLRPTTGLGIGYTGFLAAWLAGQHPVWILGSSLLLAAILISGDTLQIFGGLPSSSVNILMGLVLVGVLARLFRDAPA
jgi:simple sugar transport system permease protein